jgi:hypothetical protein
MAAEDSQKRDQHAPGGCPGQLGEGLKRRGEKRPDAPAAAKEPFTWKRLLAFVPRPMRLYLRGLAG